MVKRLLITGIGGFVGHRVAQKVLQDTDWEVVGIVRCNNVGTYQRILDSVKEYSDRVTLIWHDLRSPINPIVDAQIGHIDYVWHLAANSHVDRSIAQPLEFFHDNVIGTAHLMEWAKQRNNYLRNPSLSSEDLSKQFNYLKEDVGHIEKIINFNTDEVFGPAPEGIKFKEDAPFYPSNPYSGAKVGQCAVGECYFRTYALPVISTFTMNIFGENQTPEKLIPKAIRLAKEREPMPVFAELGEDGQLKGVGSRHWLYIDNVSDGLIFITNNGVPGERYNLVGTDELTNEDVVKTINKALGTEPLIKYVDFHKTRPGHDRRYALDGGKLAKLGWTPKISFEEGIKRVVEARK